jgi:hypothetical protein
MFFWLPAAGTRARRKDGASARAARGAEPRLASEVILVDRPGDQNGGRVRVVTTRALLLSAERLPRARSLLDTNGGGGGILSSGRKMKRNGGTLCWFALCCGSIVFAGCQSTRVTGGLDTTNDDPQSETAIAVATTLNGNSSIVVTFNDGTDNEANGFIDYTDTTRSIHPGASLMGWSQSTDGGQTFAYRGKLQPPLEQGWAVLWGDPAITTQTSSPDDPNVFIGNLAISAIPFGLQGGGSIDGSVIGVVDGACVARSQDGGTTFSLFQCMNRPTCHNCILCSGTADDTEHQPCTNNAMCPASHPYCRGEFYDGGSMAGTSSGDVFYAVHDVTAGTPDVWWSNGGNPFILLGRPFQPDAGFVTHPRVRYDSYRDRVYIAQQYLVAGGVTNVAATYFENHNWASPRYAILGSLTVPLQPAVDTSNGLVRTADQFSFDIGADEIRFFVNTKNTNTGNLSLRIVSCTPELTDCHVEYAFGLSPVADRVNPLIRVWPNDPAGTGERWAIQYQTSDTVPVGTIGIARAVLDSPEAPVVPLTLVPGRGTCPTNAPPGVYTTNYWGDYDDLQPVDRDTLGRVRFITAFTQSYDGCSKQWAYTAESQHVNATVFP